MEKAIVGIIIYLIFFAPVFFWPALILYNRGAKTVSIILNIAGFLWLAFGAILLFGHDHFLDFNKEGRDFGNQVVGSLLMTFGMLFIGIGGIIGVLNKLAQRVADPQA